MNENSIHGYVKHMRKQAMQLAAEHGLKLPPEDFDMIAHAVRDIVSHRATKHAELELETLNGHPTLNVIGEN